MNFKRIGIKRYSKPKLAVYGAMEKETLAQSGRRFESYTTMRRRH